MSFSLSLHSVREQERSGSDLVPRFSSSCPRTSPVSCQLQGAESSFFLREATQEVMRKGACRHRASRSFSTCPNLALLPSCRSTVAMAISPQRRRYTPELLQGALPRSFHSSTHLTLAGRESAPGEQEDRSRSASKSRCCFIWRAAGGRMGSSSGSAAVCPCGWDP